MNARPPFFILILPACLSVLHAESFQPSQPQNIPSDAWQTSGEGVKEGDSEFVQKGRAAFTLSLADTRSPNYLLRGEFLLPEPGASFSVAGGIQEVDGKTLSARGNIALMGDGKTLRLGREKPQIENVTTAWQPFELGRIGKTTQISMAGMAVPVNPLPSAGGGCSVTLIKGARVRNLSVLSLPSGFFPLSMQDKANTDVSYLEPLPRGMNSFRDIPFLFSDKAEANALDVAASMSGLKEPIRLKYTYLHQNGTNANGRIVLPVPGDQYSALHLVAFSGGRDGHVPRMTVSIGYFGGASGILHHQVVAVPELGGKDKVPFLEASILVKLKDGKSGYLHYLRVPMPQSGNVREFESLSIEFTRDINVHLPVPDPFEFGNLPAGKPSDVHLLAATLESSPLLFTHMSDEPGNVFSDKQKAIFKCAVTNRGKEKISARVFANCSGPGTGEQHGIDHKAWTEDKKIEIGPGETREVPLDVTPERRGWYSCAIGVEADGRVLQQRDTTFAVLAPDTRKAKEDSPFGVWAFWLPHSVKFGGQKQIDDIASLIQRGGWRWTYGGRPVVSRNNKPEDTTQAMHRIKDIYGITLTLQSPPNGYQRGEGWFDETEFEKQVIPWLKTSQENRIDNYYKVMHESRSSTDIVRRVSETLGGSEYDMPDAEKEKLKKQFENVKKYCAAIKKADPQAKIVLINDYPSVGIEFMKLGMPAEYFDAWGSEGAMFMRQPERQPDWLCLLGQVNIWKRAQKKYGYSKPVWFTEALYHGTNPGNLTLHQQAVIGVREAMLALANGIERLASCGLIKDSSDDYHWSNWGAGGYCYREPEINPKPSYAMFAWLTQLLDQARPAGFVKSDSDVLHVLDFEKKDGSHIYPIWIVRGLHKVQLAVSGSPQVFDAFGNVLNVKTQEGVLSLEISDTPVYITGATVSGVVSNEPVEQESKTLPNVLKFGSTMLQVVQAANPILDNDWAVPRLKGTFDLSTPAEDGVSCLKVELQDDDDARKLLPRYVELALPQPLELTGRPIQFSLRMKGNGGWGRVMFELADAKGRIWTSCGNQYSGASNSSDNKGTSWINFEGWNTITMPLPGQYPGDDQFVHRPHKFDWWPTNTPEGIEIEKTYQESLKKHEVALKEHEIALQAYEALKAKALEEKKPIPVPPPRRPAAHGSRILAMSPSITRLN